MTLSKEEIDAKIERIRRDMVKLILNEKRLEWLKRVLGEAKQLGFGSLSELAEFMRDHSGDIQLKEGPEVKS